MCSGPLKLSTVSKPSRPFALVESGTLCQADICSTLTQVTHALEKPQVAWPDAFSFFAASNTSGQVFGRFDRIEPRLLEGVAVDPHHGGGRVERHREHLALRGRVVAGDAGEVGVRVELLARLLHQHVHGLHGAGRRHHGGGADLEHLHDVRRVVGAERRDAGVHGVGIAALVGRHDLVFALRGVELVRELDDRPRCCRRSSRATTAAR